jgi:tubulin-specific chaperone D
LNFFQSLNQVRGYKVCLKFFHHDIKDLEFLFRKFQEIKQEEWETRYVILLWLSLIIRNPFPLESISGKKFIQELLETSIQGLHECGKVQEGIYFLHFLNKGCSIFLSRLLTRPDMKLELNIFIQWAMNEIEITNENFLVNSLNLNSRKLEFLTVYAKSFNLEKEKRL